MTGRLKGALAIGTAIAALASGCEGDSGSKAAAPGSTAASFAPTACGTYDGRGCAPESKRVDLALPSFSNPKKITNPLFPISSLRSALLLGRVDGKPFRTETTLLPGTETVAWEGKKIQVLVSQYLAYLDGRITELALDRYAQADDGSVWYFGEDVFDYEDGAVVTTEGTWLAGREGPPAMIMPAAPKVGNVYRTENVPGIVFEQVTVSAVDTSVDGPRGLVRGAMVAQELHLDGSHEDKIFAPGYGEFRTGGGGDVEALALAVPTDALPGPPPAELETLSTGAAGVLGSARARDWEAASATLKRMNAAWKALRPGKPPRLVAARLSHSLRALTRAVRARKSGRAAQASIDVAQSVLDLRLRHRPPAEIDAARFELRAEQLLVHAAADDLAGVTGDVATLEWMRDRIAHTLDPAGRRDLDVRLRALRGATDAKNLPAAADHAARLGARLRHVAGGLSAR
jgi:hypothetical protein